MPDDEKWSTRFRLTRLDIRRCIMVKQDALMESLSSNLHGFLNQIHRDLSVPDKKFLRDGFIWLARSGYPIVCQMASEVPNQGAKYTTWVKRLGLHLTAESGFDEQVKQSVPTKNSVLVYSQRLT